MRIVSVLENQKIEKRIAITPEIAKKYIALGLDISLSESYGEHLGFKDNDYKKLGVEISDEQDKILSKADIVVQLGLLTDENLLLLKENQTIVGVAKMFNSKIKFLPSRKGERYASALTSMNLSNKVHKIFGKINLEDYVKNIVKND